MDNFNIKDRKMLNQLVDSSMRDLNCLSLLTDDSTELSSLTKSIFESYLVVNSKQDELKKQITSLQSSLDSFYRESDYFKDSLIRLLQPDKFSLSLIYKLQNNIPYIKGRAYWDNKQREVQIGSIENVKSQISLLIEHEIIPPIKGLKKKDIDWEFIKSNSALESAIKYIGKIKFRQYILKHYKHPKGIKVKHIHEESAIQHPPAIDDASSESSHEPDFYSNWRKQNL
jgi:hypothetical protein